MQVGVGLMFPGNLQDEAIICHLCKKFDIVLNIIEASFSLSSGWAILRFDGAEEEIKRVFEFLEGKGVKIQQMQKKN